MRHPNLCSHVSSSRRISENDFGTKDKLRKGTLTIEEAENSLDDKFEAMTDINGWNEEGEENALVVQKPQFKKTFKRNADIGANMATKQLLVLRENMQSCPRRRGKYGKLKLTRRLSCYGQQSNTEETNT